MRRKDREMSREYGLVVIDKAAYGCLCLNDPSNPELPYAVPLSIVRIAEKLYFHSARSGYKSQILKNGQKVRIVFVDQVEVPKLFTDKELQQMSDQGRFSDFVSKVFTTEYSSAIVTGTIEIIDPQDNTDEFRLAMQTICEKYTPDKMDYFESALNFSLNRLSVFCVKIDSITSKRKKFDDSGEEMKWQRLN